MNTPRPQLAPLLALVIPMLAPACTGGASDDLASEPSEIAANISDGAAPIALVSPAQVTLAEGLHSIPSATPLVSVGTETCSELEGLLNQSCALIAGAGDSNYCWAESTFFMAHSQPRCASRLHLYDQSAEALDTIYAFDLTGQSADAPPDSCGDGIVDEGEQCDDGNREDFDGCSQHCEIEEFSGCEAVIEQYYEQAQLAIVDKDMWDGPRSHLMINKTAQALTAVDQRTCDAALAVGVDVCNELTRQMPFVASCHPQGGLRQTEAGDVCDMRFQVYFQQVSAADGVFTTALPGILAFTIGQ